MTSMSCKLSGLFSIGEDFDDEDVLGADWAGCSASGPASVAAAAAPSCALRAPSVAHREPEKTCNQQTDRLAGQYNGTASRTHSAAAQTVTLGFRQLSSSPQSHSHPPTNLDNSQPKLAQQRESSGHTEGLVQPCVAQDDFDDWDVDLADLDEVDGQMGQPSAPSPSAAAVVPPSSAKTLRPSTCGGGQTLPNRTLRELSNTCKSPISSNYSASPRPALLSATPQSPAVFPGFTTASPSPSSFSRTLNIPQQPHKTWATPRASPQARGLFETVSPAPSPPVNSHPLHTPVLTNRLVQLVSATSRIPRKRPHSEAPLPRTRRFPGPAGLLPQQPQGQNLDKIVVSVPQTPAHGVAPRLPSQGSSLQTEEDEFSGGAWAAMKAEMGLDERNPSCFLHTYSVVMVLRKAALKQLARNKVPNMAVQLKSIIHTHADAKAVFKDPTGEIQGTVHRRLLEDRVEELKVGAVLLLKQVGVFSPSHRNHYLNVTPNNLLRIYSPDGVGLSSIHLHPLLPGSTSPSAAEAPSVRREPVSQMQLMFDEEDDEGKEGGERTERAEDRRVQTHAVDTESVRGFQQSTGNPAAPDAGWDADDDLDELLGELPEDTYSF